MAFIACERRGRGGASTTDRGDLSCEGRGGGGLHSVLAADEGLRGRNDLFINSLLRPLLKGFIDFHLPYVAMSLYSIIAIPTCVHSKLE